MMKTVVLIATLASAAATVEPTALCSVGMYRANGAFQSSNDTQGHHDWPGLKCRKCPAGKYSTTTTATSCTPCAINEYQLLEGQNTCNPNNCQQGQYMSSGDVCLYCPKGKWSAAQRQICELCPSGQFNDNTGAGLADCTASSCPQGRFQAVNPARCVECGRNQYSDTVGASSCKYCHHGITDRGKTECVARSSLGVYQICTHTQCEVHNKCETLDSGKRICTKKEKFVVTHRGTKHNESSWDNGIRHRCTYSKELDECKCICWNPANPANLPVLTAAPTAKKASNCVCAGVYAPVTCSNGRTYANLCHANCHSASGCTLRT